MRRRWLWVALTLAVLAAASVVVLLRPGDFDSAPPMTTPTVDYSPPPVQATPPPVVETSAPVVQPPVMAPMQPAPATSRSAPAFQADRELTSTANIAFNTPETMTAGEAGIIHLLLDLERRGSELEIEIRGEGPTSSAVIRAGESMEARLAGSAFDIRAITPELQAISARDTTEWQWEITPREEGRQRLFLTINAIVGGTSKRSIRTFDRTIDVRVKPAGPARWILPAGAILALLAALLHVRRRRETASTQPTAVLSSTAPRITGFETGEVVAGRYRILRLVGKGGMGAVYAAEDLEFEREEVAVKTILSTGEDEERALARFKREIQLARRVAHPNVCRIFDVGYHTAGGGRIIFVTMQLVAGQSLAAFIRRRGRLAEREALPIIAHIAAALEATHAAGLIHRDVKSANVMLAEKDQSAVLMDFGLACADTQDPTDPSITKTGAVVGSPMYMAPEQAEGGALTPATDIYSFGTVIYEMVTGRLPFEGTTPMSVLAKRLREAPTPPTRFAADLDPVWEVTILKCLERDPARRFQSALDVIRALEGSGERETQVM
ncbi:MAG TPA: serine/threonine-protein kinase [Thermoanaerobaculia bacterium]|nr:serine/threonine-protein kinase [Thermoanaerobaculia bacterium]